MGLILLSNKSRIDRSTFSELFNMDISYIYENGYFYIFVALLEFV